ncbi:hypothetical protein EYF80_030691 [Liparis tanakae]|uniref:Uncharacterized protein n=1 Tax=Liparis tanakae TaxID=230148 RepID=A0A4Z2GZK6_9TELE|nr:hypothetical protein EYF80_030691 [Liparis tanakae]
MGLETLLRTSSVVSPGWMMANTGRLLGRHTQEGVRQTTDRGPTPVPPPNSLISPALPDTIWLPSCSV